MTSNKTIKHYPLSSPQRDIWFDQILHPDVPLYNIGGYVRIEGSINSTLFEKAINQVIEKNDALRIILHEGENLPTQTFAENVHIKLDFHDFSEPENARESALEWMEQEFVKPFQLYDGLLFHFALCNASKLCYYWLMKYHHLIVDGWSMSLIVQRVAAAYNFLTTGKTSEQKNYAYPDFIQNDQAYLGSKKFVKAKDYWQAKYREVPESLLVQNSAAQFQSQTISSQRSTLRLQRSFYNQLIDFAKENKVSIFHVILGALYCYFVRTCHRKDLAIGLPTLNRNRTAFKKTVGMFAAVSPAWFRFGTDLSFVELVKKISKKLQRDYRHQRFPIGEINRQVGQHNHQQLFDLTLSYAKYDYDVNFNSHLGHAVYFRGGFEQNALAIFIEEFHQQDDVNVYFDYNLGAFKEDEIERLKARFEFLLGEILRQPSVLVRELQIMPDVELQKILVEWNNTATDYSHDKTLVALFEEQVTKMPNAIAVVFENQQLTYQQLNTKSNQLAHYLQNLGVKPEVLVGICVERSIEMVVGLLGILKAGGAYLPLNPTYPLVRLAFMLEDTKVSMLLTQSSLKKVLPFTPARMIYLDVEAETLSQLNSDNLVNGVGSENLAYVIYTSGSTGQPKGVMITHKSVLNAYYAWENAYQLSILTTHLQMANFSFDVFTGDWVRAFCSGAKLVVCPQEWLLVPEKLFQLMRDEQVDCAEFVPAVVRNLIQYLESTAQNLNLMKLLIVGSDSWYMQEYQKVRQICSPSTRIINSYGLSEATIDSTYFESTQINWPIDRLVPIGHPFANTKIYILDQYLQPVPIRVPGELHIGGAGLARGYLNRPDLTAEKFINNPFSDDPNSRIYKTGDLARYLPDGNIECLGRINNQVKIRGFRIELEAIETVLAQHPDVQEAVVIAREDEPGKKRLIAYVVSDLIPTRIPYQAKCLVEYENQTVPLQTADICTAGALLEGSMSFEKGKEISLHVQLPGESESCWLKGRVAYSRASTAGIEFKLTPKEQVLMEKGVTHELENKGFLNFLQYSLRDKLRNALKEKLPDYMVPSDFVLLMSLPLTPNGKIDRRALSQLSVSNYQLSEKKFVAPRTPDEELLAGIWVSVLGVERVGVHDNFFELGGHSLLAVNLMARIGQQFGKKLPLSTIFQESTIEKLATVLNQSTEKMWSSLVAIQPNGSKPPFFCVPGIGGNVTDFYQLAQGLGKEQPFYGLQAVGLDGKSKPYTNIEDMATHYLKKMQTVQPQGPYLLGGHSFGALIAFEISQQLQKQGHEIARLAIFDMTAPHLVEKQISANWDEASFISDAAYVIERGLGKPLEVSYEKLQTLDSESQLNYLLQQFKKASFLPPSASKTPIRGFIDVYKANSQMDYIPQDIKPTRIALFQASERIEENALNEKKAEPTWGWSQYAEGSVNVQVVTGDHFTMMNQPNVPVLAEKLKLCLDQALAVQV
jgi:amino acid adenylation domain-containing protein